MSQFQPPKFQTQHNENRFKERTVGERTRHFNEQNRGENRPRFKDRNDKNGRFNREDRRHSSTFEPQIRETQLTRAGGAGKVNVVVKSTGLSDKPRVKKTGALSPRAPEKIKKNRSEEMKVYGVNACLTLFAQRPESIVRAWATVEMSHKIGEMFSYLAANKKAYHVVDREELELVSGSDRHGGICLLVKKQHGLTLSGYLDIPRKTDCLVLLDAVQNAQNIGGILRTCAVFGVKNIVAQSADKLYSAMAMRTAEGGAEFIRVLESLDSETALQSLRQAGYQIVHLADGNQGELLPKARLKNKVVFVLSETSTSPLAQQGDVQVRLSPTSPLKNGLNVAVNTGVLLSHWVANYQI